MEEKYEFPEETNDEQDIQEPVLEYGCQTEAEMEVLPPLSEEELKNLITGEELLERVMPRIKKLFE